jgi:hypothetical protein
VRTVFSKFGCVAAYLAFVAGLGALCANVSGHVATQAMTVANVYLVSNGERPLTLVERRQLDAPEVATAEPVVALGDDTTVLAAPALSAGVLAAQMDLSETADLAKPTTPAVRRVVRSRARGARPARIAAADFFGRSFGVMLMASR